MKIPPVIKPVAQVLMELDAAYPDLAQNAELDRNWIWLAVDLRGDHNKEVREKIGRRGLGFIYAANGHALPSGKLGTWAHHCAHPIRFHRKGKSKTSSTATNASQPAFSDAELMAALG